MKRARLALACATAIGAAGLGFATCGGAPPKEERLLVLDGIEIRLADVEPYVAFLDSFVPEGGRKTKIQRVLEDHLIPLRLAQRNFGEQRRALHEQALSLCSVATNVYELEQQTTNRREKRRSEMTRTHAFLPVAMYAFDQLRVGSVSPPLEIPEGWVVVGVHDLKESPAGLLSDAVDALQVGFTTHTPDVWREWYSNEKTRLADKATFVHPDYVHAMPPWIRIPPKQP